MGVWTTGIHPKCEIYDYRSRLKLNFQLTSNLIALPQNMADYLLCMCHINATVHLLQIVSCYTVMSHTNK